MACSVGRDGRVGAFASEAFDVLVRLDTFPAGGNAGGNHDQVGVEGSDDGNGLGRHCGVLMRLGVEMLERCVEGEGF